MKVLQINSVCGLGSTGRIVTDIDTTLRENKIESYIAYGRETSILYR
jgi:putative colanic acid biosynthesis glycosyltransferase